MNKPDDWGTQYLYGEPLGIYTAHPMHAERQEIAGECPHCGVIIKIAVPPMSDPSVYVKELKNKFRLMDAYIKELEGRLGIVKEKNK